MAFLRAVLKNGPVSTCDIAAQAKEQGIRWRTLRRASDEMNLIKRPGSDLRWRWALPATGLLSNLADYQKVCTDAASDVSGTVRTSAQVPIAKSPNARERWLAFQSSRPQTFTQPKGKSC